MAKKGSHKPKAKGKVVHVKGYTRKDGVHVKGHISHHKKGKKSTRRR
jgi:hypothetical protein